jgi:hypothetical protein
VSVQVTPLVNKGNSGRVIILADKDMINFATRIRSLPRSDKQIRTLGGTEHNASTQPPLALILTSYTSTT